MAKPAFEVADMRLPADLLASTEVHLKKASRQMRLKVLANLMCCSWEQRAKVPPKISLMSVCEMSTVCSLSQCSHAAGPIQLKSADRVSASSPASEKHAWYLWALTA